jgi:hypothetical protein
MQSKRFTLNGGDGKKLAKSFGLAFCGFAAAWFAKEAAPVLKESDATWAILVATVVPVAINLARKWLAGPTLV